MTTSTTPTPRAWDALEIARSLGGQDDRHGEQYRVILNDELAATFTVLSDALDFYAEHTCHCDIQTWTKEKQ